MAKKDYYEVLGVSKNVTEAEIKSAYRRLARQHHPDVDKSTGSAERFKEISEAYQVLSNQQKRQAYDQFGHSAFQKGVGAGSRDPFGGRSPFGQGGFSYSWSSGGNHGDFVDPFDLFEQIFGGAGGFGAEFAQGFRRRQTYQMDITFDEAVKGVDKQVEVERIGSNNQVRREKMVIKVPAGVDSGTKMRFGDMDIVFRVRGHQEFHREGSDIFSDLTLSIPQVVLGDTVEVQTVHGKVRLKISAGSQPGSLIRLKGKGVPTLRGGNGDHYVRVIVSIPKNISERERELYQKLAEVKSGRKGWF